MPESKCDVIVLAWNKLAVTKSFVESFFAHTTVNCRLIIIDNGSTDGTAEYLALLKGNEKISVKAVINPENLGFVQGMNQGIALSNAPYVCLANNDLLFTDGWLEEIIRLFESNSAIGVLNPNSNNLGARSAENEPLGQFAQRLGEKFSGCFEEMPFCIGFCMCIRRSVIAKVGGLSEEFIPMFFEDTDYSLKAAKAGYLIGLAKGAYVWHKEHVSFKLGEKKWKKIFSRNKEIFQKKWGKTLRITWIIENKSDLDSVLSDAVILSRAGNFVWVAVKNLQSSQETELIRKNFSAFAPIKFINFQSDWEIFWRLIVKKKRPDLVINKGRFLNAVLAICGYNVSDKYNVESIVKIKYIEWKLKG